MDRLDRISALAIILLLISCLMIAVNYPEEEKTLPAAEAASLSRAGSNPDPALENRITLAGELLNKTNLGQAEQEIELLIREHPYEGRSYMLKGDLYMRQQKPLEAMMEYRKGIDLNPDFLDKKTPLFQGKKIRVNLTEALPIIESRLQTSKDRTLIQYRNTLYYLQRRLAGSCG